MYVCGINSWPNFVDQNENYHNANIAATKSLSSHVDVVENLEDENQRNAKSPSPASLRKFVYTPSEKVWYQTSYSNQNERQSCII